MRFHFGKCGADGTYLGSYPAHAHTNGENAGLICIGYKIIRYWKRHPAYGYIHVFRTIFHEVAHLQVPNAKHGAAWKERAIALCASRYWLGPEMKKTGWHQTSR